MDAQASQVYVAEPVVRNRKWPLYLAVAFLGLAMTAWSIVLPVFGILYLVQLLS